jgi:hypothetical protein
MARKGGRKQKNSQNGIRSKKKDGLHVMDRLQFASRAQEKVYTTLAMGFLKNHVPKIMNIVPKEVREKQGETRNTPGKLAKDYLQTINTKETYIKRFKTFLKYQVIHNGIKTFGEIDRKKTERFFQELADNVGTGKAQYSTKTYDSYVDGIHKGFAALTADPEHAKGLLSDREYGKSVQSLKEISNQEFRNEIRNKIGNYSQNDYKRGGKGKSYDAKHGPIIMKQAEKLFPLKKQLLIASYVYVAVRNEEGRKLSLDCYNREKARLELLKPYICKQDRGRVVLDMPDKLFDLADKVQKEHGYSVSEKIFDNYTDDDVREMIEKCCLLGKIRYSAVHPLRDSWLDRTEKKMFKEILNHKISKSELIERVMEQVNANPKINELVPKKIWVSKTKNGKVVGYYQKNDPSGEKEMKFSYEKLKRMEIENILDLYLAEQLGHNKVETNDEYRSDEAKKARQEFRKEIKERRKKGDKF